MGQDGYPRTFTNLSVPSVIFADASWYGSLRGGVELGGDADGRFSTTGSRWGIKGSTEVSEGLSAVYLFETRVGSGAAASQGTNQLYAGLSGGFGSLTLGKFHNAAYNGAGSIRDQGWWYSSGDAATKIGNTVSYAFSSDAANFQVDAIMDSAKDSGRAIDEVQFGVSVNLGEIGKVGLGYENVEDWDETKTVTTYALKSGKVTSDFMGDFTVPSSDISGGIDADLDISITPKYTKPNGDAIGNCRVVSGQTATIHIETEALCDARAGSNTWVAISDLYADATKGLHTLTESYDATELGIEGINKDKVSIKQSDKADAPTVMSRTVSVSVDEGLAFTQADVDGDLLDSAFDGTKFADPCDPEATSTPFCAQVRVFYTENQDGEVTRVDDPGHTIGIKLNDGSLTAGSATPTTDTRTIDSSVDDLTVEANPAGEETTPMDGYKATHVSVQLNLGAMTLGLGYSEKESNKMGSMDQKTTFVGASGSIGDTGMGWRAWTRDISNVDNAKGDANPWGIGINKDLGGGAFTFVEHHDADAGASGNTIIALGVNF